MMPSSMPPTPDHPSRTMAFCSPMMGNHPVSPGTPSAMQSPSWIPQGGNSKALFIRPGVACTPPRSQAGLGTQLSSFPTPTSASQLPSHKPPKFRARPRVPTPSLVPGQQQQPPQQQHLPHHAMSSRGSTPVSTPNGTPMQPDENMQRRRESQRLKQVLIGKATVGYRNYTSAVAADHRVHGVHPSTPRHYEECSKRKWEGVLRLWRKALHHWDNIHPDLPTIEDVHPGVDEDDGAEAYDLDSVVNSFNDAASKGRLEELGDSLSGVARELGGMNPQRLLSQLACVQKSMNGAYPAGLDQYQLLQSLHEELKKSISHLVTVRQAMSTLQVIHNSIAKCASAVSAACSQHYMKKHRPYAESRPRHTVSPQTEAACQMRYPAADHCAPGLHSPSIPLSPLQTHNPFVSHRHEGVCTPPSYYSTPLIGVTVGVNRAMDKKSCDAEDDSLFADINDGPSNLGVQEPPAAAPVSLAELLRGFEKLKDLKAPHGVRESDVKRALRGKTPSTPPPNHISPNSGPMASPPPLEDAVDDADDLPLPTTPQHHPTPSSILISLRSAGYPPTGP
eukprot:Sspe_Gene.20955::Locus_7769_Transcript_1_1_Confidence_1.000_Length_1772::g.20955::m.20955